MFDGLNDWDTGHAIVLAVLLLAILLGSAGLRTIGLRKGFTMVLAWVAIFGAVFVVAAYR